MLQEQSMNLNDENSDGVMKEMIRKEMLKKIEEKINSGDKEIFNAIKFMIEEDENNRMKF